MFLNVHFLKRIFEKHSEVICTLIWLLMPSLLVYQYSNGFVSGFGLTFTGAFLSTLFVFIFIEYSMLLEKERKWKKCKEYTFYILNTSSKKFICNFVELKKHQNISQETFVEEEEWLNRILNDRSGDELKSYIETLDNDYWYEYENKLTQNYNTNQIEKIFEKLISLDVEEKNLIDTLSEFLIAKEKLRYLIGWGNYSSFNDGDEHEDAMGLMLIKSINIYHSTMDRS